MGDGELDHFDLTLLGSWQLQRDGVNLHVPLRQQRLIAALGIYGARPRSYLHGLLWPESTESRAKESLRVSVHLISRQVPGLLVNGGPMLSLEEAVRIDLTDLRDQIKGITECGASARTLQQLARLRNADLLPGWYEDWVLFEQTRLEHARLHALQAVAGQALSCRRYDEAIQAAEAALELEPLYESAIHVLILALREQGNDVYALQIFRRFVAQLNTDMGLAPSKATCALLADLI
jgi:DNA-binding SARP family transcriptional activator